MMKPQQIDLTDAVRIYYDLKTDGQIDWEKIETPILTDASQIKDLDVELLVHRLEELKRKYPGELPAKGSIGTAFDAKAAVIIHECLRIEDGLAARQEFWAWLSLKFFWPLITWRHKGNQDFAIPQNFSVTTRKYGLLERLWFRAELGKIDGADSYKYVRTATDRDFWESGIIRTSYSSCRAVAKALIRYQFQNPEGYLHLTDPGGIRTLYKRIKRIYATVALDVLSEKQAYELVAGLAHGLAKSGHGKSKQ